MNMIRVSRVGFRYVEQWVLRDISFCVNRKEVLGIIGPNGSGKTTLLKSLNRTITPEQGDIFIDGTNIKGIKRRELARIIGTVPQEASMIFPFTILEMVLMGRAPYLGRLGFEGEQDYEKAIRAMEMTDTLPFSSRKIDTLSGGEKQRVLIARAITQEPVIMLLDEPTSFLDIKHQIEIYDLIKELNSVNGVTVIIVSHDINLAAQYCGRVMLMNNGRVFKIGSPDDVVTKENIEEVYGCQVLVDKNPVTERPRITPLSSHSSEKGM